VYAEADVTVDSLDGPPEPTVEKVAAAVAHYVETNRVGPPEPLADDGCIWPANEDTAQ
jgi:hypothetical protein